jgi:hypothetical protein
MKIAIIGGGWVGCHLALKLMDEHEVTIFEKNDLLFHETSFKNQNRLHFGYHYARNFRTRHLCENTFNTFINDYGFLVKDINKNFYCVPKNKSIIDFGTFTEIFKIKNSSINFFSLTNMEGCVLTNEKYIDYHAAHIFFNQKLKKIFKKKKIDSSQLVKISKNFDLIINATNNEIKDTNIIDDFYELTISLIYEKVNKTEFDSLTIVDGQFFSIYPYKDNLYTVTDVEHTPIKRYKKKPKSISFVNDKLIKKKISLIENKIFEYYPNFKYDFKYADYFLSFKTKYNSASDDRYPIVTQSNNIINCFTGKIQGIYIIENKINELISNFKNEKRGS